jgi:hypothetical protein
MSLSVLRLPRVPRPSDFPVVCKSFCSFLSLFFLYYNALKRKSKYAE